MNLLLPILLVHGAALPLQQRLRTGGAHCYFTVWCSALCVLYLGAIADMLRPAAILVFGGMALAGILYLVRCLRKGKAYCTSVLRDYFDPAVLLGVLATAAFAVIFTVGRPQTYYWDEFAFWNVAAKYVKCYDQLYTLQLGFTSILPPMHALIGYFIMFFAREYADSSLLFAYAAGYIAVFCLAAELVWNKSKNLLLAAGTFFALVASPLLSIYHRAMPDYSSLDRAYGTAMVDFALGVYVLGCVAVFLADKRGWSVLPALACLTLLKNTAVFFALLSAAVVLCFVLTDRRSLRQKLAFTAVVLATVAAAWASWNWHTDTYYGAKTQPAFTLRDPDYDYGPADPEADPHLPPAKKEAKASRPMFSIFVPALRTERHRQVLSEMAQHFKTDQLLALCPDRVLIVLLTALGLLSAALYKKHRAALLLTAPGLAAGCFVYNLTISYFIAGYDDGMVEYPRYMTSYYVGWLYVTVLLLLLALCAANRQTLAQAATALLACASVWQLGKTGIDYTVFHAPENAWQEVQAYQDALAPYRSCLTRDTALYVMLPDLDTEGHYLYRQAALPALANVDRLQSGIDFTVSFRTHITPGQGAYYNVASPETFAKIMQTYFDYVLVADPDPEEEAAYDNLFAGGMRAGVLYKVTDEEIPMQEVQADD